jgi:hypothetical protein
MKGCLTVVCTSFVDKLCNNSDSESNQCAVEQDHTQRQPQIQ